MNNVLEQICEKKRQHVAQRKTARSLNQVINQCELVPKPHGFINALEKASRNGYGLIAEIKRASPSKGRIRKDFNPKSLANAYKAGGATCISVLTDTPYFEGCDEDLSKAKEAVNLPILRKDFMLDPYQIHESRALGADCILLIIAALSNDQANELEAIAISYGMDVLIEVHNQFELEQALKLKSPLIGVNNRDLKTLKTNLETTKQLASRVPENKLLVSESGLYSREDLAEMALVGARCFLIGESLMRQDNVTTAVQDILLNPFDGGPRQELKK